jgi:hypothetical protein
MVEFDGTSATFGMNMELNETLWADEYSSPEYLKYIREQYRLRHVPVRTPLTHPQDYDPINPPTGWRYDPFCECWCAT